jgi:hypothetical protein
MKGMLPRSSAGPTKHNDTTNGANKHHNRSKQAQPQPEVDAVLPQEWRRDPDLRRDLDELRAQSKEAQSKEKGPCCTILCDWAWLFSKTAKPSRRLLWKDSPGSESVLLLLCCS